MLEWVILGLIFVGGASSADKGMLVVENIPGNVESVNIELCTTFDVSEEMVQIQFVVSHWILLPSHLVPGLPLPVSFNFYNASTSTVTVQVDLLQDEHTMIVSERRTLEANKAALITLQIPDDLNDTLPYTLLVHGLDGLFFYEETTLYCRHPPVTKESFHIYIQTDKAIYKPGQTVRFRTFGMFSNMTVYTGPLNISITDPKSNMIKRWLNAEESQYGVIENYMLVDTEPLLGAWSVVVKSREFGTTEIKKFNIDKYVLPKFDVTVEMPPFVLTSDKDLTGTVKATYTYGKPVEGTVLIRADLDYPYKPWNSRNNEVMVETRLNMSGETDFVIPLTRIASEVDPNDFVPLVKKLSGYHVTILASVTESINNITRNESDSVMFYNEPYIVKFVDNDYYFKNGLPYTAQLKLTQADGRPILSTQKDVLVTTYMKFYDKNVHKMRAITLPDQTFVPPPSGILTIEFDTPPEASTLHLEVHYKSFTSKLNVQSQWYSNYNHDNTHDSIKLVMKSSVAAIGQDVHFSTLSTSPLDDVTFMVLNNELVLESGTVSAVNGSIDIVFPVTPLMAPYSQLVVYFFDAHNQWNSDSIYFNINDDAGIFRNQVSLGFNASSAEPGTSVQLHVSTSPQSKVNILAVDQSLILLAGSANDITQTDVISSLKTDTAPTTMGNSYLYKKLHFPEQILYQTNGFRFLTDVSGFNSHKKRQVDCNGIYPTYMPGMMPTAAPGMTYAPGSFPVYSTVVPMPGVMPGATPTAQPALQSVQRVRKYFPETWLWTNTTTSADGNVSITTVVPDTITSWVASAFSVSPFSGLGIAANHAQLKTFRPFFVSLNLPYSVIRGEEVVLQANVFNYMSQDMDVVVTLEKSDKFKIIVPTGQAGATKYVSQAVVKNVQVAAGKAVAVFIPVLPEYIGKMDISVKAQSVMAADAVRRQLLVEAEGILVEENLPVLLVAGESQSIPIAFPQNVVTGSQNVRVSVMGDVMSPVLKNMGSLLRLPTGCGEQTMTRLAPDVFLANYLSATGQLSDDIRDMAVSYMERGYQRELTFQHYDGSFSIWGESDYRGSTWLTAFVLKSFHQARKYIFVSDDVLRKGLNWLMNYQNQDGSFRLLGTVHDNMLMGGSTGTTSMAAFVLLALLENDDLQDKSLQLRVQRSAARARGYLERLTYQTDTMPLYDLAIVSYALAKSGSSVAPVFFTKMDRFRQEKDHMAHWSAIPEIPNLISGPMPWYRYYQKPRTYNTEIAAYGLLYYIEKKDLAHGLPVLKWLLTQRNAYGGFTSTQDTVLALQALSEYQSVFSGALDLSVDVTAGNFTYNFNVQKQDALVMKTTKVPSNALTAGQSIADVTRVNFTSQGQGTAQAQVSVSFHVEQEVSNPAFNVTTNIKKETVSSMVLESCVHVLPTYTPGMTVMEVGIPSGFIVETQSLSVGPIASRKTEMKDRYFVLYFDRVSNPLWTTCVNMELVRSELVAKSKPAPIKVYDYYEPSSRGLAFYESQLLKSTSFCDICSSCQC